MASLTVTIELEKIVEIIERTKAENPNLVEVVRCKECKWSIDFYQDGGIYCRRPNESMEWHGNNPNYYCADGKRRED